MITLFTTFYPEKNNDRRLELEKAIKQNLENKEISKLVIFNEGADLNIFESNKLQIININERPTYNTFFDYINANTTQQDINIIANTDIVFDKNIRVLDKLSLDNKCFALSRWEINKNKIQLFNRNDSQDTWIFKGKIKPVDGNFLLGVPRCDNRIMYELTLAGYTVLNPSFSIRTYHYHSGIRISYSAINNTQKFVPPPYKYLYPHNLFGMLGTIKFNLFHTCKLAAYKYDIKKINNWIILKIIRKLNQLIFKSELPLIGYKSN